MGMKLWNSELFPKYTWNSYRALLVYDVKELGR